MPNESEDRKKLDATQIAKVVDWLKTKWIGNIACECCGSTKWEIQPHTVAPLILGSTNADLQFGGLTYPYIMVMCTKCANTKFLNAVWIGILKPKDEENAQ